MRELKFFCRVLPGVHEMWAPSWLACLDYAKEIDRAHTCKIYRLGGVCVAMYEKTRSGHWVPVPAPKERIALKVRRQALREIHDRRPIGHVNVSEFAQMHDRSESWVRKQIGDKTLHATKIGKEYWIPKESVPRIRAFAANWDKCISCGSTEDYHAKGLCNRCYTHNLRRKRR